MKRKINELNKPHESKNKFEEEKNSNIKMRLARFAATTP